MPVALSGHSAAPGTYVAPIPLGTCKYEWRPEGFQDPFAPTDLDFSGTYTLTLPWANLILSENSSRGPYQELFSRPDPARIIDGPYTFFTDGFESGDTSTFLDGGGVYLRKAGRLRDAVEDELVQIYRDDGFVSVSQAIDATLRAGGGEPGTVLDYQLHADSGPLGTHLLRCFSSAEPPGLAGSRDSLVRQSWNILGTRFTGTSEDGSITVRFFDVNTNRGPRGPGIDTGEEIFDALINMRLNPNTPAAAVTDCNAFATCP